MERFQKPILLSILGGMVLYLGAMFLSDFQATRDAILNVGLLGWAVILGLSLFNYALRYWRWDWYLHKLSQTRLPHRWHLAYYVCGFALSTTPGKAGETVRSLYLKRHGISYSHAFSTFFVERFLDLLSIVLISCAAGFLFKGYGPVVLITGLVVFGSLPLVHSRKVLQLLTDWSGRHQGRLGKALEHLVTLLTSSAVLLRNRELFVGLVVGVLAWLAEAVGFWYLLHILGQDVSVLMAVSIYGVAVLVGAISFLPGGLGSTEAVMTLLLVSLGVEQSVALAATLICRIATLWFAVFMGLIVASVLAARGITPMSGDGVKV